MNDADIQLAMRSVLFVAVGTAGQRIFLHHCTQLPQRKTLRKVLKSSSLRFTLSTWATTMAETLFSPPSLTSGFSSESRASLCKIWACCYRALRNPKKDSCVVSQNGISASSLGYFDEVQRAPKLPAKAPKELKELDDTKSRMGLAELYEEEYSQKAGLATAPLPFSNEQRKEASFLFKKLCLKLDALSHFHFAPKPVIKGMSIQANVPALAMEEIAPLAVSDAAMLAPEEIFSGKGNFKDEKELTQADRKWRRAKKKRKFKELPDRSSRAGSERDEEATEQETN